MAVTLGGLIQDPDSLSYELIETGTAAEIFIDTALKEIELSRTGNLTADGATLKCIYSKLKEIWKTDTTLIKYPFPMTPITDEQFEFINGWRLTAKFTEATSLPGFGLAGAAVMAATPIASSGTNGSRTVTSAALFGPVQVGQMITGTGIPAFTFVTAKASTSSITISQAYTGSTGVITGATFSSDGQYLVVPEGGVSLVTQNYYEGLYVSGNFDRIGTLNGTTTVSAASATGASFTGFISGRTLTITAVASGRIVPGQTITGVGVTAGTTIEYSQTGTGGTGTYIVSVSQTVASTSLTSTNPTAIFGDVVAGMTVSGDGIPLGTTVSSVTNSSTIVLSAAATQSYVSNLTFSALLSGTGGASGQEGARLDAVDVSGVWAHNDIATGTMVLCDFVNTVISVASATTAATGTDLQTRTVTTVNTTNLRPGMAVSGTGIQPNTYIMSIVNGVSFTISRPAIATGTVTLSASNRVWGWSENDYTQNLVRSGGWALKDSTNTNLLEEWANVSTLGSLGLQGFAVTLTGVATTVNSTTLTCASTTGVVAGSYIVGPKIPDDTTVVSVTNATTLVLSRPARQTSSGGVATIRPKDAVYHQIGADVTAPAENFALTGSVNQAVQTFVAAEIFTGTTTNGSTTISNISLLDATGLQAEIGLVISGPNIPTGATLVSVALNGAASSAVISSPATGSATSTLTVAEDFRLASSIFRFYVREQGYTYGFTDKAAIGESVLTYKKYPFPLSNVADLKITHVDSAIDANGDNVADQTPYSNMSITWYANPQVRRIGTSDYNFSVIIDADTTKIAGQAGTATAQQIYEFTQWKLRRTIGIDTGTSVTRVTTNGTSTVTATQVSVSSTTVTGSPTITTAASFASVNVGDAVSGTGIPAGAFVIAKASTTSLTISHNATASATNTLAFGGFTNLIAGQQVAGTNVGAGVTILTKTSATSMVLSSTVTAGTTSLTFTYLETGNTTRDLLKYVGDTLYTQYNVADGGVYIDNFATTDINSIVFYDNTNTARTFPYTAAGSFNFNSFLQTDGTAGTAIYNAFYSQLSGGRKYGTSDALLVKRADNTTPLTGTVPGSPGVLTWDFDYDNNTDAVWLANTNYVIGDQYRYGTAWYKVNTNYTSGASFGVTDTTNSSTISGPDIVVVAIGLSNAQYVSQTGTIGKSVANSVSLVAAIERNYLNPL